MTDYKQTITLTWSESIENHTGMQIIGEKAKKGFSYKLCEELYEQYKDNGAEFYRLNDNLPDELVNSSTIDNAAIVVFRDGVRRILNMDPDAIYTEQSTLETDKKAFMYGRVVNKKARHNLCFADFAQSPNYAEKMGTVYAFNDPKLPLLRQMRTNIGDKFGSELSNLFAEGNYYYDVKKTYIGMHGDTERSKVFGVRLGAPFDLHYKWYHRNESVDSTLFTLTLNGGDMYMMSDKATGNDWKKRSTPWHLRHGAGDLKNIT